MQARRLDSSVRTFDWDVFEQFLTDEIVRCVDDAGARNPDSLPRAAALFDLHARDMLVLFPAVAVTHDRAENSEPWAVHPGIGRAGRDIA